MFGTDTGPVAARYAVDYDDTSSAPSQSIPGDVIVGTAHAFQVPDPACVKCKQPRSPRISHGILHLTSQLLAI
eukprot:3553965-Rhodomonas_salina.3